MGQGTPTDILHAVQHGTDLFDCVLPSRNARHGVLFTRAGVLRIKNARFRADPRPIDEECQCVTCHTVSRAFLHHLVRTGELTGAVLATQHNIRFYLDFVQLLRKAISSGTLAEVGKEIEARFPDSGSAEEFSQSRGPAASIP
jgi:queuine tRNA-ribosyltransferase